MPLLTFSANSGRTIFVEAIYAQPTYLAVEIGDPDRETNCEVVQHLVSRVRKLLADIPIIVVGSIDVDVLPQFCVAAKAFSTEAARDVGMQASKLVFLFFTDNSPYEKDISAMENLRSIRWETHAQDFN